MEQKLFDISGVWDLRRRAQYKHNIYQVSDIIIFSKYRRNRRDQNDLALVKVDRKIQFTKTVMPICLPTNVSCYIKYGYLLTYCTWTWRRSNLPKLSFGWVDAKQFKPPSLVEFEKLVSSACNIVDFPLLGYGRKESYHLTLSTLLM